MSFFGWNTGVKKNPSLPVIMINGVKHRGEKKPFPTSYYHKWGEINPI